ncbi:MAG TPA: glycerol-3-phosphate acyltransferase [Verrucomicrobiae bacterium]|jgi:glycerol-3-phosphate acyltransferase PlsY|nr:glycerol-3-phosphate acyltransferase [Verrucomicrobiae bacterium]
MSWIEQLRAANWHQTLGVILGAYVLGCFATGYYLVRMRTGQDIRELGSCNVGAKNVGRILGKSAFIITALGDVFKGMLAVWATSHFTSGGRMMALAMLLVIIGHVWPAQLRFHGGKGVSTLLGALVVYDYRAFLIFLILFTFAYVILRKTVLPGLFGVVCLSFTDFYFNRDPVTTTFISFAVALVLFTHRKNIVEECAQLIPHHDTEPQPEHPDL